MGEVGEDGQQRSTVLLSLGLRGLRGLAPAPGRDLFLDVLFLDVAVGRRWDGAPLRRGRERVHVV